MGVLAGPAIVQYGEKLEFSAISQPYARIPAKTASSEKRAPGGFSPGGIDRARRPLCPRLHPRPADAAVAALGHARARRASGMGRRPRRGGRRIWSSRPPQARRPDAGGAAAGTRPDPGLAVGPLGTVPGRSGRDAPGAELAPGRLRLAR